LGKELCLVCDGFLAGLFTTFSKKQITGKPKKEFSLFINNQGNP